MKTLRSRIILIAGILALTAFGIQYAGATKTTFSDGTPSMGIKGTKVTAAFLNAVNNHYCTGLAVDGDCSLAYAQATGTNDLLVTLPTPTITQYINGMPIYLKSAETNTGAMTVNINNLGIKSIKKNGAAALIAGDVQIGQIIALAYDGTNFQLQSPPSGAGIASGYATLDVNSRLVQDANTVWDGGAGRTASQTPGAYTAPISGSNSKLAWGYKPAFRGAKVYSLNTIQKYTNSTSVNNQNFVGFDTLDYDTDNIRTVLTNTCTISIATPAVISATAHGLSIGDPVRFTTTGALPTGLLSTQYYYVLAVGFGVNSFEISAEQSGTAVNTSGSQSGTQTVIRETRLTVPSNVTKIRLCTRVAYSQTVAAYYRQAWFIKNANWVAIARVEVLDGVTLNYWTVADNGAGTATCTPVMTVTGGDYFQVSTFNNYTSSFQSAVAGTGQSGRADIPTVQYFSMEIVD